MDDYAEATSRQAWCHQQIGMVQGLIGQSSPLVWDVIWGRYYVPGSTYLKNRCREENGVPVLMSADRLRVSAANALAELRAHVAELFGEYPL